MINLGLVIPTQLSVRHLKQILPMKKFVDGGGFFTRSELDNHAKLTNSRPSPLIQINQFEDGSLSLLDGHHRAVGIFEGGRNYFHSDEYKITNYTYQDFIDIVFTNADGSWMGWVTPFDPRERVRLPDNKAFKEQVTSLFFKDGELAAKDFIINHINDYSCLRTSIENPLTSVVHLRNICIKHIKESNHVI